MSVNLPNRAGQTQEVIDNLRRGRKMPKQDRNNSKQDYATPEAFIVASLARLRIKQYKFDFAADLSNFKADRFWGVENDALTQNAQQWAAKVAGGWGWLNPPFKDIAPWARKCAEAEDEGAHIAFLVPASVGANWFSDYIHHRALVLGLNGRIDFIAGNHFPKDCMLCLFGPTISPGFDVWCWK